MQSRALKKHRIPTFFNGKRNFCLVMIVDPDAKCRNVIEFCKKHAHPMMKSCFQPDGSLHFTLFANQPLTYDQAIDISYTGFDEGDKPQELPLMELNGFLPWNHCVALGSDTCIDSLIENIQSELIPEIKWPSHPHMTLYRMIINWEEVGAHIKKKKMMEKFNDLQRKVTNQHEEFGCARGDRLVLKEMGADYFGRDQSKGKFFRVIYSST